MGPVILSNASKINGVSHGISKKVHGQVKVSPTSLRGPFHGNSTQVLF